MLKNNTNNSIFFVDENFNTDSLKQYIPSKEYSNLKDFVKLRDTKKKILIFDLNPKKKIVLISLKKQYKNFLISENLGAKFFDLIKSSKDDEFYLNSMVISSNLKVMIGYFLHGLKLKSYIFEKIQIQKNKKISKSF